MKKINDLDPEDISMYYQIENYELSQKKIKQSINYYYEMKDKLELFLISDKWLNKWKEYSCINYYSSEEIKSQPYNWEKLRKQKRSKIKLDKFNNDDIIQFNNISRSSDFNSSFRLCASACLSSAAALSRSCFAFRSSALVREISF